VVEFAGTEMTVKGPGNSRPAVPDSGVVVIIALRFPPVPTSMVTAPPHRPSEMYVRARREDEHVTDVRVGGYAVEVLRGRVTL